MKQQEYWNSVSKTKTFTTPFQAKEFAACVGKDALVLDVGCGYGRTLQTLYEAGYRHLMGVDFSEGMIARGKDLYPYLDLRVKKGAEIALPDCHVDAVILFAVLTCIHEDEKQKELIREIRRVLKPGGILYVNDFLLNSDERNKKRYEQYQEAHEGCAYGVFELPEGAVLRHHDEAWIRKLMTGFAPAKYERLTFTTMNGHTSNGFYFIGRKQ